MAEPFERMKELGGGWRRRSLSACHLFWHPQRANMRLDVERMKELVGGGKSGPSQLVIFIGRSNMPSWFWWVT
jgi:hypothetical protein